MVKMSRALLFVGVLCSVVGVSLCEEGFIGRSIVLVCLVSENQFSQQPNQVGYSR
jgi:hypothetical protein